MEIQDFVEQACLGVICGMKEARKKLDYEIKLTPETIEFDVAVAVENSKEISGKIEVLGSLGSEGGFNNTFTNTNRVRFKIFVSSETIEERGKIREEMCKIIEEQRNSGNLVR